MNDIYASFGIKEPVRALGDHILSSLAGRFAKIDEVAESCQLKVIRAMQEERVTSDCFHFTSGYGYDDVGRDTLERVYARVFGTEEALVRPSLTCSTHALSTALSACLRPGDELVSVTGKPYDTLEEVIGIRESAGSLAEFGIRYRQVPLLADGSFDYEGIKAAIGDRTKMAAIQRSKGYQTRPSFGIEELAELIRFLKECKADMIVMVDNCYGEFVETAEPGDIGADLVVGSLIKNPGGGLAPLGGYIAGRSDLIDLCARRLTAPGLGREVGASLNVMQSFYQGFFLAPVVTASAAKTADFAAAVFSSLGYDVVPGAGSERHDIIQSVVLGDPDALCAFCRGIQKAAPVDSHVTPVPWDMPGYDAQVIMAAGAFNQGSSIELSADGPMKPPYAVYFQGGLTWPHGKLGILMALEELFDCGLISESRIEQAMGDKA